ncbi:MAG: serine/threonine protein kinase [Spirochaetales bacterium]|nr:serine/threonine protein kinase [Spirochaetales bacterium]
MCSFDDLTPDKVIKCAEDSLGFRFSGYLHPLPSYINRVYEIESSLGERYIIKFYRPGRWSLDAILDEHDFILDCYEAEIPVVPPLKLIGDGTISEIDGIYFGIFNKRSGRLIEIKNDEEWIRLGAIIGRMHQVGNVYDAENRVVLHPSYSTKDDIAFLIDNNLIPEPYLSRFLTITNKIMEIITPLFANVPLQRIHGDCHAGNILEREKDGLMLIDFDDMVTGPKIHDLWLLLPGYIEDCRLEMDLLIEGYTQFSHFNNSDLKLIEPLRVMRMIYFTSWCGSQIDDLKFRHNFPEWGTPGFWEQEINDLETQLKVIIDTLDSDKIT